MTWLARMNQGVGRARSMTWIKPEFYREFLSLPEVRTEPPTVGGRDLSGLSFSTVCRAYSALRLHRGRRRHSSSPCSSACCWAASSTSPFPATSWPMNMPAGSPIRSWSSSGSRCTSAPPPALRSPRPWWPKGFSPGAALIFLMTGPATNTGTIAIVASQFGARFASVYVGSVIAVTAGAGHRRRPG